MDAATRERDACAADARQSGAAADAKERLMGGSEAELALVCDERIEDGEAEADAAASCKAQAALRLMQQRKQPRPQQRQLQQRLQPLLPSFELAAKQQQQQQLHATTKGGSRTQAEPAAHQGTAHTAAVAAEAAGIQRPDFLTYDAQLVLHDLTSAVPFAPRSFISNDGTTFAPSSSQHRRRLSVAIPNQDGGGAVGAAAGHMLQSPMGGMMASLMAEAATSHMAAAQTPWSVHPNMCLLSPSSSAVLDASALAAQQLPGMEHSSEMAVQLLQQRPRSASRPADPPAAAADTDMQAVRHTVSVHRAGSDAAAAVQAAAEQQGRPVPMRDAACAGRKRDYSAMMHDNRCAEMCNAAQAAALAAIGSPSAGATCDRLAALLQWQHTIEAAEAQWGPLHPAVGRAWLELARALQAVDKDSERAKLATKKAFDICQILLTETATESHAQESFQYMFDKFNRKATAAKQQAAQQQYAAQEAAVAAAAMAASASAAAAAAATMAPTAQLAFPHKEHNSAGAVAAAAAAAASAALQHRQQLQQQLALAAAEPALLSQLAASAGMPSMTGLQALAGLYAPSMLHANMGSALLQPHVSSAVLQATPVHGSQLEAPAAAAAAAAAAAVVAAQAAAAAQQAALANSLPGAGGAAAVAAQAAAAAQQAALATAGLTAAAASADKSGDAHTQHAA